MARRILLEGLPDPREAAELLLSAAEGAGARGFQYREIGEGALEVLVDGEEGLAEDLAAMAAELWPGSRVRVEAYGGRVMDLDFFKRVLHTREHPEEARRRRSDLAGEGPIPGGRRATPRTPRRIGPACGP